MKFYKELTDKDINIIREVVIQIRKELEAIYGEDLIGKCIECSDNLVPRLKKLGYNATSHQGYCLYEYFENCTDRPYDDHVYTLVRDDKHTLYLDATLDQFQPCFIRELPKIAVLPYIPNFILKRKPGENSEVLRKCGWIDYYNGYAYENNFDYWGVGRLTP